MLANRPMGQGAASKKYDVLTALGAYACAGDKWRQRVVLRFMTLVTARYNWQRDELSIGRRELARLWQVDERTVKRDMGKLKQAGWLSVKRPSARGRVAVYAIDWACVLETTRSEWSHVGPDFADRATFLLDPVRGVEHRENTVVAFPKPPIGNTVWDLACAVLHRSEPAFFANWLAQVRFSGMRNGVLELVAPSAFHAQYLNVHANAKLTKAVKDVSPDIHRIVFLQQ